MHMYVQGGVKVKIEYFGYFCEVVESQGISVAAQKMYISQQGLSKALNVIESELGTTLLNRNRNSGSVSLTAEGQIFYDYASSIWKEYSRMCTVFQSLKGKQSGGEKVTICSTKFLLNNVLTPVFHTMTAAGKELPAGVAMPPLTAANGMPIIRHFPSLEEPGLAPTALRTG